MQKKKVLVTGADGFIGSHLTEKLVQSGCDVRAFVFYNSFNTWGWLDTIPGETLERLEIVTGDIRDPNGVRAAVEGVDTVFHLAALIGIPFSYRSPDSYVDTNIRGTLNILASCRELGVRRVVVTSTSEVYGTARYVPINESHPLQGQSPYSATKIGADKLAESYFRSFDLPVVIVRPFNTYGPRQSARAIIPTIITQILGGAREIQLGSLHPTRDLTYVEDTCRGFLALADCDEAVGKEVNIGTGNEVSMGDLARMIISLSQRNVEVVSREERKRPGKSEVERLLCDNSLARRLAGWTPEVSLEEGLTRTMEWFSRGSRFKGYKWDLYNV